MGYEHVSEGFLRSSVEYRRIKNAKITAMRHRKWQEIRLQREQEEKKVADEFLKRRRKERARLAAYIYSSAQNADKESHSKLHSSKANANKNRTMWEEKRDDHFCRENNWAVQKTSSDKDIILDVCSLPTISIEEKPSDKFLQKHRAEKKSAAIEDFLQEALQQRLENEAATSILIAEITDMKSRLDDLLAMPSKGHYEDVKKNGFEHTNIKMSCTSSDKEHDKSNVTQLREREVPQVIAKDNQGADKTKCCMLENYKGFAKENRVVNRLKCCLQTDYPDHAVDSYQNKSTFQPSSEASTAAADSGKCMGLKIQSRQESEGSLLQQERIGEKISPKVKVFSCKSSKPAMGVPHANGHDHALLSSPDGREECNFLQRLSQELCDLEVDRNVLDSIEEDIQEKKHCSRNQHNMQCHERKLK